MQKPQATIRSQWTHSLNFNLLSLSTFTFFVLSYLLNRQGKFQQMHVALIAGFVFLTTVIFLTVRRNVLLAYNDQHLQVRRFPYVAAKKWHWSEITSLDINDEWHDESTEKTGEALYLRDVHGNKVLVAHRSGEQTELRQVARELRRRLIA